MLLLETEVLYTVNLNRVIITLAWFFIFSSFFLASFFWKNKTRKKEERKKERRKERKKEEGKEERKFVSNGVDNTVTYTTKLVFILPCILSVLLHRIIDHLETFNFLFRFQRGNSFIRDTHLDELASTLTIRRLHFCCSITFSFRFVFCIVWQAAR